MSTNETTQTSPSSFENDMRERRRLVQLAARLSVTALNERGREFEPWVLPVAVENIGRRFQGHFEFFRARIFDKYDGGPEKALSDVHLELWLACHTAFYSFQLRADSRWRPTLSEDEEREVEMSAIEGGLGSTLRFYGYGGEMGTAVKDHSIDFKILNLRLLSLADKAAFEGRSDDAFDWLHQALHAWSNVNIYITETHGIKLGKRLGRTEQASLAGKSRWDQSLGSQDKAHVLTLWNAWQTSFSKYRGNAEFSRNAIKECAVIEDTKTIERWSRVQTRANRLNPRFLSHAAVLTTLRSATLL